MSVEIRSWGTRGMRGGASTNNKIHHPNKQNRGYIYLMFLKFGRIGDVGVLKIYAYVIGL